MDPLDKNETLSRYANVFRQKHSFEHQLINTVEYLVGKIDKKSRAKCLESIDTEQHQHSLLKLRYYGVNGIQSIRQNNGFRRKNTLCSMEASLRSNCKIMRTALLYLLYNNDIGNNLSLGTSIRLFADDCLVNRNNKSPSDTKITQKISRG
ncbi:unnamed protein product [Mytilus edulis]|uniref:Reverse transcriptase domain-containing protein n=1 Tax=Mytilus edulis TaxID=6550 RepID=A0A8S3SY62_MYTED|nr:unnamed protein product [Mytilus edulis]